MSIESQFKTINDDKASKYPLYLDPIGVSIVYDCLSKEKESKEKEGTWTLEYESPYFESCVYLNDVLEKAEALLKIIKAEEELSSKTVDYALLYKVEPENKNIDIPF